MLVIVVSAILLYYGVAFFTTLNEAAAANDQLRQDYRTESVSAVATALQDYYDNFGDYPDTLDTLRLTPGFDWVNPYIKREARVSYARATGLAGGAALFTRAVAFTLRDVTVDPETGYAPTTHEDDADFLADNRCGGTTFTTTVEWCGDPRESFWKGDTRDSLLRRQYEIRKSLNRTIYKALGAFQASGEFPRTTDPDATRVTRANLTIAPGDSYPLRDLAYKLQTSYSVGTSSATCNGQFMFGPITLECDDLYSPGSGLPVQYGYIGPADVIFSVDSGINDTAGSDILIAQEAVL